MIATVILAAGQAKRMGRLKQLLPWGKDTILGKTIDLFQQANTGPIYVVVGSQATAVKEALGERQVVWVHNPDFAQGMSSSLQAGLGALPEETEAVLLALGDLPLINPDTVRKMVVLFRQGRHPLVVPRYQGRTGHPVLIAKEFFPQLMVLKGDQGARGLLKEKQELVCYLEVDDPGICQDIDDPQTYARLRPWKEEYSDAGVD